jgi:D-threo-aldose 1-dehydrogenase
MQFPLRHPAVANVVAGMRTAAQVKSSVSFMQAEIPEGVWPALDDVAAAPLEAV